MPSSKCASHPDTICCIFELHFAFASKFLYFDIAAYPCSSSHHRDLLQDATWPFSSHTFRLRFKDILGALQLQTGGCQGRKSLDVGSLRPGGATWLRTQALCSAVDVGSMHRSWRSTIRKLGRRNTSCSSLMSNESWLLGWQGCSLHCWNVLKLFGKLQFHLPCGFP